MRHLTKSNGVTIVCVIPQDKTPKNHKKNTIYIKNNLNTQQNQKIHSQTQKTSRTPHKTLLAVKNCKLYT